MVLGAVAEEKQSTIARDALHQSVEHRLCLRVDPVEILEHEDDRLAAALLEQQQLHSLQRPPPLLLRIELPPLGVVARHVEERENGGDRKSTRLNSSHGYISYAVFCLKKKKKQTKLSTPVT